MRTQRSLTPETLVKHRVLPTLLSALTLSTVAVCGVLVIPTGAYVELISARRVLGDAPLSPSLTTTVLQAMARVEKYASRIPPVIARPLNKLLHRDAAVYGQNHLALAEFIARCLTSPEIELPKLATQSDNLRPSDAASATTLSLFFDSLETIEQSYNKGEDLKKKVEILSERMKNLGVEESLVIKDLTQLFSLPIESEEGDTLPFSAPRYEEGILSGLPRIKGVPDSVTDLTTLRDSITVAGGSVTLSAPDPVAEFSTRVENMKKVLAALDTEHEEITVALAAFAEQQQGLATAITQSTEQMKLAGKEALIQLAR